MNKLTKGQYMCLQNGWHCDKPFICRFAYQAKKMGLRLEYKKKDLDACSSFTQMIAEGSL
jgi:hypothetical protein